MSPLIVENNIELEKWNGNFWKLYGFSFFQVFLVAIPVIVPFWQSKNLSLGQIFTLQAIFGGTLIIFDAPAGYMADLFGRKVALIAGTVVSLLGWQLLWWGENFWHFALYEIILGVGLSLQSGCDVAILYSSLEKLKLSGRKAKYLGRRVLSMQIGEGVASLLGGYLATMSLRLPMIVNAIVPIGTVIFASLLFEGNDKKLSHDSHFENFKMIRRALFGHSRLLTLLIVAYIFYSFATYCAIWTLQVYWQKQGLALSMFGYLWAANCFLVGIVGHYSHRIEVWLGSTATVVVIAVTPIIGYLGMGTLGGWLGISFMIFFPMCRGLNVVLFQDAVNSRVPAEIRATTNSIGSLGMRMLFLAFGPLLGFVIDQWGPAKALEFMGYVYVVGFFVVAVPLLRQRHEFVQT